MKTTKLLIKFKCVFMDLDEFSSDNPIHGLKQCHISNYIKLNMSSRDMFNDSKSSSSEVNNIDTEDKCENEK